MLYNYVLPLWNKEFVVIIIIIIIIIFIIIIIIIIIIIRKSESLCAKKLDFELCTL